MIIGGEFWNHMPAPLWDRLIELRDTLYENACERNRPSVIWRPRVYRDGDQWCALLGKDIVEGVVGFGPTPEKATQEFDKAWHGASSKEVEE